MWTANDYAEVAKNRLEFLNLHMWISPEKVWLQEPLITWCSLVISGVVDISEQVPNDIEVTASSLNAFRGPPTTTLDFVVRDGSVMTYQEGMDHPVVEQMFRAYGLD
jgi:hypothetical protein